MILPPMLMRLASLACALRAWRYDWTAVRESLRVPLPLDPPTPAYTDGQGACAEGVPREECPYVRKQQAYEWRLGWDRALQEQYSAW